MRKLLTRVAMTMALLTGAIFWLLFFSPRPPLTTSPETLACDGSLVNYCALPPLDGSGKLAAEIPKGNTPDCRYSHFPLPILAGCTEPLIEGADDIRGLWLAVEGKVGHVERIEQCGARTVITTAGLIHDAGPNSTAHVNTDDTEGTVFFTLGEKEYCPRTSANMTWNSGKLNFHLLGWGPQVVQRYLDGDQLIWAYADGSITRMARICELPQAHKTPKARSAWH